MPAVNGHSGGLRHGKGSDIVADYIGYSGGFQPAKPLRRFFLIRREHQRRQLRTEPSRKAACSLRVAFDFAHGQNHCGGAVEALFVFFKAQAQRRF